MKNALLTLLILTSSLGLKAQSLDEHTFDFWLGKWDLTWAGPNGAIEKGTNHIHTILDGKVIQENFEALTGSQKGFKGISISVYNPNSKAWRQTWMDNQSTNINLIGKADRDKKIFQTGEVEINGVKTTSRMAFYNITADSFVWDWEQSNDSGTSWNLVRRINYKRAQD